MSSWWMYVGTSLASANIWNSGSLGANVSATISGLPTNGQKVYVRLWYFSNEGWKSIDETYTASTIPEITNPSNGSTIRDFRKTFRWTSNGLNVTQWWMYLGSYRGGANTFNSGPLGIRLSASATVWPKTSKIYARLWYRVNNGKWQYVDSDYNWLPLQIQQKVTVGSLAIR